MFLKNKNIIFKIRRSKVTDYAALSYHLPLKTFALSIFEWPLVTMTHSVLRVLIRVLCLY